MFNILNNFIYFPSRSSTVIPEDLGKTHNEVSDSEWLSWYMIPQRTTQHNKYDLDIIKCITLLLKIACQCYS